MGHPQTVQNQIRRHRILHCLLIECTFKIRTKLKLTTQQPLHLKWIRPIDLFDFNLYVQVNNLSATSGRVFLSCTSTKLGLMCRAQGHNTVTPVRLESSTLPLSHCALFIQLIRVGNSIRHKWVKIDLSIKAN